MCEEPFSAENSGIPERILVSLTRPGVRWSPKGCLERFHLLLSIRILPQLAIRTTVHK
jgi:hypothetical protein